MRSKSAAIERNPFKYTDDIEHVLPLLQQSNRILEENIISQNRSVSLSKNHCYSEYVKSRSEALNTHTDVHRLESCSEFRHREFLDEKNQLNLIVNERQQLEKQLSQLQDDLECKDTSSPTLERALYLQNRLDEQKLRLKEVESIQQIYITTRDKLVHEKITFDTRLDANELQNDILKSEATKLTEIYYEAMQEVENCDIELELLKEQLVNIQQQHKTDLSSQKDTVKMTLKRQEFNFQTETLPSMSYNEMEMTELKEEQELIKPLYVEKIQSDFVFKSPYEFANRCKMTEGFLNKERESAEERLEQITKELESTENELIEIRFEQESSKESTKSIFNNIQEEIQNEKQVLLNKETHYHTFEKLYDKIEVFFDEVNENLKIIENDEEISKNKGLILGEEDSIENTLASVGTKIATMQELFTHTLEQSSLTHKLAKSSSDEEIKSMIEGKKEIEQTVFDVFKEDKVDELHIFGDLQEILYDGELPGNCKVKFEPETSTQSLNMYTPYLSEELRKVRAFRLDRGNIKKESVEFAEKVKIDKLKEAGYYD